MSAPPNFKLSDIQLTRVGLSWEWTAGASAYVLKRDGVVIYEGPSTIYFYSDASVSPGQTYSYTLTAKNGSVGSSPSSLTVETPSLPKPVNFKLSSVSQTNAAFSWEWTSGAATYVLKRDGNIIYEGPSTNYYYSDTSVFPGQTYIYTLTAKNGAKWGVPSSLTVTTPKLVTPTGFKVANLQSNRVDFNWDWTAGAAGYLVRRNGVIVYDGTATSYADTSVSSGQTYTFALTSKKGASESTPTVLIVTTP